MNPKVTVLMPVYNGGKYIREAIKSILSQSFTDFEFLIIDDGSTDNSVGIVQSFSDNRIRLIKNNCNIGIAESLNKGIESSKGEYIVRMDADDISFPDRIKKQVAFMDANPEVGVSGTWIKTISSVNECTWFTLSEPDLVRCHLLFGCPLAHPTVILRTILLKENELFYDKESVALHKNKNPKTSGLSAISQYSTG